MSVEVWAYRPARMDEPEGPLEPATAKPHQRDPAAPEGSPTDGAVILHGAHGAGRHSVGLTPRAGRGARPLLRALGRSAGARRASLRWNHDQLVVLDLDSGEDKARVSVPSPSQAFLFPAPGFRRNVCYQ